MDWKRFVWVLLWLIPAGLMAQEEEPKLFELHGEIKAHYRWSEDFRFPLKFPFPPEMIPSGQTAVFERTVSPGSSFEISAATLILDIHASESVTGKVRINFIDLYNRNPTSTDQTVNVKEAWLQFGQRAELMKPAEGTRLYALFGKAPKFERQPDRNMESYGLVSTVFNRFEDLQLQVGGSAGPHFYWRTQISSGNPVFFRDPNALAGDNGNYELHGANPQLHRNSGFPILYDAETEELSFQDKVELGLGLGFRFQDESQEKGFDLLGFYYRRELANTVDLRGTFYGGDLDLLDGVAGIGLPIQGNDKKEFGANVEVRLNGWRVFTQIVRQELAALKRNGYEVEVLWRHNLPPVYATNGKQLFTFIQPVVRFSLLDNDFKGNPLFVAPSTFWDWKKFDVGVRMGILQGFDITIEYSIHDIGNAGPKVQANEFMTTLRARF